MGLKRYDVTVEGRHNHTTTLLLSDEDAKRMGVFKEPAAKPAAKAQTPANKARAPRNKQAAKPAAKSGVEAASDPDASEA